MDKDALHHCLTDEERQRFERDGFLLIPNALPAAMVQQLTARVDRHYAAAKQQGQVKPHNLYEKVDFIGLDPLFLDLIDWPKTFPKIWGLLGWNISLFHTHMNITPPRQSGVDEQKNLWNWHQDNGQINIDLRQGVAPRLSLKVAFYLTDLTQPRCGNTYVIPGSYRPDQKPLVTPNGDLPPGAMPLTGKPGDAMILDQRIWHSSSPNFSAITRKLLFIGYGYRWLHPLDTMQVAQLAPDCDPIRQQLLDLTKSYRWGAFSNRYYPSQQDVPLLQWLNEQLGADQIQQPPNLY